MGASSWQALSDTIKSQPDKSSYSLKSLSQGSVSVSLSLNEQNDLFGALSSIKPSGDSASTSSGQCQRNSNQNVNPHNHQSHGLRLNQEHVNQNWNLHRNFNGRGSGFTQPPRGTPGHSAAAPPRPLMPPIHGGFAQPPRGTPRHAPPPSLQPPMASTYTQYMQVYQPNYSFLGPMIFPDFAPPIMYYSARVPFVDPIPSIYQVQDSSLEFRIRDQVHYYFSLENLSKNDYMRKRIDDEGFVHIQFIASFNKLKALTNNIEFILFALRDSDVVELKSYEIRSRDMWKKFLIPPHLRITFNLEPNSRNQRIQH